MHRNFSWRRGIRAGALLAGASGLLGCPQLLPDEFHTSSAETAGSGGQGGQGQGGSSSTASAGGTTPSDGGTQSSGGDTTGSDAAASSSGGAGDTGGTDAGAAGSAGAVVDVSPEPECAWAVCGQGCVDLESDAAHCGQCDRPLASDQVCKVGEPVSSTEGCGSLDLCGQSCVNLQIHELHCGTCDTTCKQGAVCTAGACKCPTAKPSDCGDVCAECCSDAECQSATVCSLGLCVPVCELPKVLCVDRCVNVQTDANSCGQCGNDCGQGRTCQAGACSPSWVATTAPPAALVAREKAASTALDTRVFIWGGVDAQGAALASGALYDPTTNRWTNLAIGATTPSARASAVAVWTGSEVLLWGGGDASDTSDLNDGARLDPGPKTWLPMSALQAPSARRSAHAFWTGSQLLLWSGSHYDGSPADARTVALYNPTTDQWTAGSSAGAPPAADLVHATAVWNGVVLYVFGGKSGATEQASLFEYDPVADRWTQRPDAAGARSSAFGAWNGSSLVIWGGLRAGVALSDGQRWFPDAANPNGGSWLAVADNGTRNRSTNSPETGWATALAPGEVLMLGGVGTDAYPYDGVLYDGASNTWSDVSAWPSAALHLFGVGVWTGSQFVLWGGRPASGVAPTALGERFRP